MAPSSFFIAFSARVATAGLVLCCVCLAPGRQGVVAQAPPAVTGSAAPATASGAVIPPGQEELLSDMLGRGAALPAGCKLTDGQVEYSIVRAIYTCPSGEVVFELGYRGDATPSATQTDRFAIALRRGTPPDDLLPALLERIRAREAGFQWTLVGQPRRRFPITLLIAVGLLGIVVLGWVLRSRAAARRAQ